MVVKFEEVLAALLSAGQGAFEENWTEISGYAGVEFEKWHNKLSRLATMLRFIKKTLPKAIRLKLEKS